MACMDSHRSRSLSDSASIRVQCAGCSQELTLYASQPSSASLKWLVEASTTYIGTSCASAGLDSLRKDRTRTNQWLSNFRASYATDKTSCLMAVDIASVESAHSVSSSASAASEHSAASRWSGHSSWSLVLSGSRVWSRPTGTLQTHQITVHTRRCKLVTDAINTWSQYRGSRRTSTTGLLTPE